MPFVGQARFSVSPRLDPSPAERLARLGLRCGMNLDMARPASANFSPSPRRANASCDENSPTDTPTIWKENNKWYLFYERDDLGIWLATSTDCKKWTNLQDEPVLKMGPDNYDQFAVAMNQVIKYKGLYYGYYHASAFKDWHEWSTNVAVSADLVQWKKYSKNPIVGNNRSSGIMVNDGNRYRLYTMHPEVNVYFPVTDSLP